MATVNLYSVPSGDIIVIPPPINLVSNSVTATVFTFAAVTLRPNATAPAADAVASLPIAIPATLAPLVASLPIAIPSNPVAEPSPPITIAAGPDAFDWNPIPTEVIFAVHVLPTATP